jgi:tetratricopeptide (TPR) repeat protein
MHPPRPSLHARLAWLVVLLVLACRPSTGPVSPLVPAEPLAAARAVSPPPPVSLTASDGTGLVLAALRARAVIDDPFALTELELSFDNPRHETIEGRFELVLPPGARVTRFALQVGSTWQEAEVVERQAARRAYEVSLYEGRDPALLERDAGNRFGARVFPIEPHERKRIRVSYVEELSDPTAPWRFAVRGLPPLEALELEALVVDPTGRTHREHRRVPAGRAATADFAVPRDAPRDQAVRHGEQVTARVQPLAGLDLGDAPPLRRLTVLVDTSASRALDFDASLATLARVLQALARDAGAAELRVLAFDQVIAPIYAGPLVGLGATALKALHARRPLGASNLGLALRALEEGEHERVLLVSDGLVSAGEGSDAALRRQLLVLAGRGVQRLDALVLGQVHDEARLRRLVAGPLPSAGVLLRADVPPERIAARLRQPTLMGVRLTVPGARWWSPTRLDGLQPDDHVLVYADLPEGEPLRVQISGPVHRDVEVPLRTTDSPLHDHGWRRAQIEGLVERLAALQDQLESARLRRHVVALSVRHRIVNDLTALLVLEHDEDYARFGLDRRALEDVLVVGPHGAEVLRRDGSEQGSAEPTRAPAVSLEGEFLQVVVQRRVVGRRERREDRGRSFGLGGASKPQAPPPRPTVPQPPLDRPVQPIPPPEEPEPAPTPEPEPEAPKPQVETTTARVVTVEEFRDIPVGGQTSRDYTAVLESTATVTRDSAGISLAGTTGAESKYIVEGANLSYRSTQPVPAKVYQRRTQTAGANVRRDSLRRALRTQRPPLERCYFEALTEDSALEGRLTVRLELREGRVIAVYELARTGLDQPELLRCLDTALRTWTLPRGITRLTQTLVFRTNDGIPDWFWREPRAEDPSPLHPLVEVHAALARGDRARAWSLAVVWRERAPVDVLALVALGDAARARGDLRRAARAYGSIIDLYPSRADMLRFAAAQLEALDEPAALDVAIDAYRRAVAERPDHPTGHRNLALALLRSDRPREAFEALERALRQPYPPGRFAGADEVLRQDLGIAAAAWKRREPTRAAAIADRLAALGVPLATAPSLRIVLTWESDVSDVDLHVIDAHGDTAFAHNPALASGGGLLSDVTNGFGPEHAVIPGPPTAYPYALRVHYYARGVMGYGMGKVSVLHHDGEGDLRFDDRPFVALTDNAWLDLGTISPPTQPHTTAVPPSTGLLPR